MYVSPCKFYSMRWEEKLFFLFSKFDQKSSNYNWNICLHTCRGCCGGEWRGYLWVISEIGKQTQVGPLKKRHRKQIRERKVGEGGRHKCLIPLLLARGGRKWIFIKNSLPVGLAKEQCISTHTLQIRYNTVPKSTYPHEARTATAHTRAAEEHRERRIRTKGEKEARRRASGESKKRAPWERKP